MFLEIPSDPGALFITKMLLQIWPGLLVGAGAI